MWPGPGAAVGPVPVPMWGQSRCRCGASPLRVAAAKPSMRARVSETVPRDGPFGAGQRRPSGLKPFVLTPPAPNKTGTRPTYDFLPFLSVVVVREHVEQLELLRVLRAHLFLPAGRRGRGVHGCARVCMAALLLLEATAKRPDSTGLAPARSIPPGRYGAYTHATAQMGTPRDAHREHVELRRVDCGLKLIDRIGSAHRNGTIGPRIAGRAGAGRAQLARLGFMCTTGRVLGPMWLGRGPM